MKAVLDHVGIAVSDLQASLAFFRDVLGLHVEASEEIASQQVRAHFLSTGQSTLEVLEATAPDSPIAKYLEKRGPGMHHVALRVDDIDGGAGAFEEPRHPPDRRAGAARRRRRAGGLHPSVGGARRAGRAQAAGAESRAVQDGGPSHARRSRADHAVGRVLRARWRRHVRHGAENACGKSACRPTMPTASRSACGRSSSATAGRR